jgi:hypothetical protein
MGEPVMKIRVGLNPDDHPDKIVTARITYLNRPELTL